MLLDVSAEVATTVPVGIQHSMAHLCCLCHFCCMFTIVVTAVNSVVGMKVCATADQGTGKVVNMDC